MDFRNFHPELASPATGRQRMERFYQLSEAERDAYWRGLRKRIDAGREAKRERSRQNTPLSSLPKDVHERLLDVDAEDYVRVIAGVEASRGKRVCCPLPDHGDESRDFSVKDRRWRCFGCNRGGNIYDLASLMWGVPLHGQQFKQMQERLVELRLVA